VSAAEAFSRYRSLIDDWDAFVRALARPLPVCVWANTLRGDAGDLARRLAGEGVEAVPMVWNPGGFRLPVGAGQGRLLPVLGGFCQPQEEVSMVPVVLLDPRPGERVLDLCACPGNKTAQIAVAMKGTGTVVANDVSGGRMRALRNIVERLGLFNVIATQHDGTNYPRGAGSFDRVLVDAPCSCEGTTRKNPSLVEELLAGDFRAVIGVQRALLRRAVRLCRTGGRVVYATCTYAPEENEALVDEVLAGVGPDRVRLLPARLEGLGGSPGVTEWDGRRFHPDLALALRMWPHQNDSGGFFVAVMEKVAGDDPAEPDGELPTYEDSGSEQLLESGLGFLEARFGIPPETFRSWKLFRGRRSGFYLTSPDLRPPRLPRPDSAGVFFLKTSLRFPKISTAAAMAFGGAAVRNVVDLGREEIQIYLERRSQVLSPDTIAACTGPGYAMVRHGGAVFGLGFLREPGADGAELDSYFPKGWGPAGA
jgi:NOL1/NOP2/sun family putative RNA methylase